MSNRARYHSKKNGQAKATRVEKYNTFFEPGRAGTAEPHGKEESRKSHKAVQKLGDSKCHKGSQKPGLRKTTLVTPPTARNRSIRKRAGDWASLCGGLPDLRVE